ncbi:MAG TPA: hypothetical protein VNE39_18675 [Planctomycetota bacterium]|nr:hypothetical protein [Planctomycetota bacterium]
MRTALVAAAVWLAPLAALAGEERPRPEPAEERDQDAEQRIKDILRTKKVTFDFVETPLADVMNFMQALLGVNLIVDPGLDRRAAVTLRVNEMPVGQALQWIARMVGARADVRDGAVVIEPARGDGREPGPRGRPDGEPPPGPRRPFGRATLSLGPGLSIEMELGEDDLRPEARQLLLFLLHRQIVGEAQKHDPKAIQEFMEGAAKRRQMEAEMRQRLEALRHAAMEAEAARRRAEEEARRQRERREKPEGGDRKGQF